MARSYEMDMVHGPLVPKILQFSIPLMFSGILQLLFNAADIIVVGQFTGPQAMAAVGATSSLNNLIVNIFLGLSIGSSVMMSRYYGARDEKNIDELVDKIEDVVIRLYQYTERKMLLTIEVLDGPDATPDPTKGQGGFYVLASEMTNIMQYASDLLNQIMLPSST